MANTILSQFKELKKQFPQATLDEKINKTTQSSSTVVVTIPDPCGLSLSIEVPKNIKKSSDQSKKSQDEYKPKQKQESSTPEECTFLRIMQTFRQIVSDFPNLALQSQNDTTSTSSEQLVSNKKESKKEKDEMELTKTKSFTSTQEIFERMAWDPEIDKDSVTLGYIDRFCGIMETDFVAFSQNHDETDGIPFHRIRYFKIDDKIVWSRDEKLDLLSNGQWKLGSETKAFEEKKKIIDNISTTKKLPQIEANKAKEKKSFEIVKNCLFSKFEDSEGKWVPVAKKKQEKEENSAKKDLRIINYNVLYDKNPNLNLCDDERCEKIISILCEASKTVLQNPDSIIVINLQEVSKNFLEKLQNCQEIQQTFFISDFLENEKSYNETIPTGNNLLEKGKIGNLMLSSEVPQYFHILSFTESNKKFILANFEQCLGSWIVNLHLSSDLSSNFEKKREDQIRTLQKLLKDEQTDSQIKNGLNILVCGDFNTENIQEPALMCLKSQKFLNCLSYLQGSDETDSSKDSTKSFDPELNACAALTSKSGRKRDIDNVFLFQNQINLDALKIHPQGYTLTGKDKFIAKSSNQELHPSDHFCQVFDFKIQKEEQKEEKRNQKPKKQIEDIVLSHDYALIIPIISSEPPLSWVENLRAKHDPAFQKGWMPHISLEYPFIDIQHYFPEEEEGNQANSGKKQKFFNSIKEYVAENIEKFSLYFEKVSMFEKNGILFMEPDKFNSEVLLPKIYSAMNEIVLHNLNGNEISLKRFQSQKKQFHAHYTFGKFPKDKSALLETYDSATREYDDFKSKNEHLRVSIEKFTIIKRNAKCNIFETICEIPLKNNFIFNKNINKKMFSGESFFEIFAKKQLQEYETSRNDQLMQINWLENALMEMFTAKNSQIPIENPAENLFFMPYGSFTLGIPSNDVDFCVCINSSPTGSSSNSIFHSKSLTKDETSFFEKLFFEELVKKMAKEQISFELRDTAIVPSLTLLFKGMKIDVCVLFMNFKTLKKELKCEIELSTPNSYSDLQKNLKFLQASQLYVLNGLKETIIFNKLFNQQTKNDGFSTIFKLLLFFMKKWANQRKIYSNYLGFLGGISFAILCYDFLDKKMKEDGLEFLKKLEMDPNCFFEISFLNIVQDFLKYFKKLVQNSGAVCLINNFASILKDCESEDDSFEEIRFKNLKSSKRFIQIFSSVFPFQNTCRNLTSSTNQVMKSEIERALELITGNEKSGAIFEKLLEEAKIELNNQTIVMALDGKNRKKTVEMILELENMKCTVHPFTCFDEKKESECLCFKVSPVLTEANTAAFYQKFN